MSTERESRGFLGPVQSVRTEMVVLSSKSYKMNEAGRELWEDYSPTPGGGGVSRNRPELAEVFIFDVEGRIIEEASAERSLVEQEPFRYIYTYNDIGQVVERADYNEDGSATGKTTYTYDSTGSRTAEVYYDTEGGKALTTYEAGGCISELDWYRPDGSVSMRRAFTFKIIGSIVEQYYYEDGMYHSKSISVYNQTGQEVERAVYNRDGSLYGKDLKTYDAQGLIVERAVDSDADGVAEERMEFTYDDKGTLLGMIHTRPKDGLSLEPVNRRYIYAYDFHGNIVEFSGYDADGSLVSQETYAYEYDSYGNWIKQTKTSLSNKWKTEPFLAAFESIEEYYRTIIYFEEKMA